MVKRVFGYVIVLSLLIVAGRCQSALADSVGGIDFRDTVSSAKGKVFPTVTYIRCLRESHEGGKKLTHSVSGSGVVISSDGEVITNWHVIDKAIEVRCLLSDGTAYDAEIIGSDKDTDLALLKLKDASDLAFASLGDSSLLVEGDFVMAMGAPFGLNRSVSIGIISCTTRYLNKCSEYSLWFQTDASINPGNSGGPLVDTNGQVIGINTRGGNAMGFAVPANTVKLVIGQIREFKEVNWSWNGLQLQPLRDFEKNMYFKGDKGVIVSETDPDSPARLCGILPQDRILSVAGEDTTVLTREQLPALQRRLGILKKGEPVEVVIQRNGKEPITLTFTPRKKGKVEGIEYDCKRWDMTVKTINQFDNKNLYFYKKQGVYIFGVRHPGNAGKSGLRKQDIILKIDGQKVDSLDDMKRIHKQLVDNVKAKGKVSVFVMRNGMLNQFVLDFSRNYEKE